MVRRAPRTGPALHQLTRVPEAAVSLVVDAISVEPSLEGNRTRSEVCVGSQQGWVRCSCGWDGRSLSLERSSGWSRALVDPRPWRLLLRRGRVLSVEHRRGPRARQANRYAHGRRARGRSNHESSRSERYKHAASRSATPSEHCDVVALTRCDFGRERRPDSPERFRDRTQQLGHPVAIVGDPFGCLAYCALKSRRLRVQPH